jgi:hypothetical protein
LSRNGDGPPEVNWAACCHPLIAAHLRESNH